MTNTTQKSHTSTNKQSVLCGIKYLFMLFVLHTIHVPLIVSFIHSNQVSILFMLYVTLTTLFILGYSSVSKPKVGSLRELNINYNFNKLRSTLKNKSYKDTFVENILLIDFVLFNLCNFALYNLVNQMLLLPQKFGTISTYNFVNIPILPEKVVDLLTYTTEFNTFLINAENIIPINAFFVSIWIGIYYGLDKNNTYISAMKYGMLFFTMITITFATYFSVF